MTVTLLKVADTCNVYTMPICRLAAAISWYCLVVLLLFQNCDVMELAAVFEIARPEG